MGVCSTRRIPEGQEGEWHPVKPTLAGVIHYPKHHRRMLSRASEQVKATAVDQEASLSWA